MLGCGIEERRLLLRAGTIVDATIIAAPSSPKNATATATRDEADPQRAHLALRHEAAHRGGQAWHRPHRARDRCAHRRHHSAAGVAAWAGAGDFWRSGVLEGSRPAGVHRARHTLPNQSTPHLPAADPTLAPDQSS